MTLQVFVAHTGDTLEVDSSFESVDDFKASLAQASRIPSQEQILLTLRGKHVKQTTLFSEVCALFFAALIVLAGGEGPRDRCGFAFVAISE